MTREELKQKQYDTWNKYYQKHKSEINARRKKVREGYKNKLSVAEKRIAELEKENSELKEELKKLKETIAYFGHWYDVIGEERVLILEKSIKYIADLENENAELKAFRQDCIKLTEDNVVMARQRAETSKQLTKAKELLKESMNYLDTYHNAVKVYNFIAEAEQFIKYSEVEK